MERKQTMFLGAFLLALLLFTVYVLLDTFVIVRKYEPAEETQTVGSTGAEAAAEAAADAPAAALLSSSAAESGSAELLATEDSYRDGSISVELTRERIGDTAVYVAEVKLASPESLRSAFAGGVCGRNVTEPTSSIAEAVDAVLAVNGDFYGAQQSGYVIRNGVLYRSTAKKGAEDLVIYADGSFAIIRESEVTAEELLADGAQQVLSFGPALVEDGAVAVSPDDEVGRARASNPRTAIAVIDELHYLFVVSDGRTEESEGLSLYELAAFLQSRGAQTAYNLDGGGSSTMVFNGLVVNKPTSGRSIKERSVSDIVYVG